MSSPEKDSSLVTIKVASPVAIAIGKLSVYTVARNSTVLQLKIAITERFPDSEQGPTPDRQRLIFRGKILEDNKKISEVLKENDMQNASSVHFHLAIKPVVDSTTGSGSNQFGGLFTNRIFGNTPSTSAFSNRNDTNNGSPAVSGNSSSSSNSSNNNINDNKTASPSINSTNTTSSTSTSSSSSSSNIGLPAAATDTSSSMPNSSSLHTSSEQLLNNSFLPDRMIESEVSSAPAQPHLSNIWTSNTLFGSSSDTTSLETHNPSDDTFAQNTTTSTSSFAFNSSHTVFDSASSTTSTQPPDIYTTQVQPQGNAGILDFSKFSFSVTESGARTVNFIGPHSIIIPVPVEQVAFIRNHANELLCCLAPEALVRMSNILHRPVEPEPLSSQTPIYTDSTTGLPSYNPNLPIGRNLYLSTPVVRVIPTSTQPTVADNAQVPAEMRAPVANQPLNGIRIGFGTRTFDINAQFFRNNFGFISFLLKVIIIIDLFVMDFSPMVQLACVAVGVIIALLWSNNILQRAAAQVTQFVNDVLTHLPHGNPAVPAERDQQQDHQNQDHQRNQEQQPQAVELNEEHSKLKEFALSVKRFVLMFVGTLIPFVYDMWIHEEAARREHAERIAERQRLEEQRRLEEEQRFAEEQQTLENVNDQNQQLENDKLPTGSENFDTVKTPKISEVLRTESLEPLADAPAGPSGSAHYINSEDQTLLHRNV